MAKKFNDKRNNSKPGTGSWADQLNMFTGFSTTVVAQVEEQKDYSNFKTNNNKENRNNNSKKSGGKNIVTSSAETYVGAPYNFVPFSKTVVEVKPEKMLVRDKLDDELLSGEIDYVFEAKTPIFVGDTKKGEFFTDECGRYVIPGSSIRGLIRNNVQILGLSSFADDIDDYKLMYRNVTSGALKGKYNDGILGVKQITIPGTDKTMSALKNVKAGYIIKKGGEYYICMTTVDSIDDSLGEMNYYPVSERSIQKDLDSKGCFVNFSYFDNHKEALQHDLRKEFEKYTGKDGKDHYKGTVNPGYSLGHYKVSYAVKELKNISEIKEPGKSKVDGYLVCTGYVNEKKALYVVPAIDETKEPIKIEKNSIVSYNADYEAKKNLLGSTLKKELEDREKIKAKYREFFALPQEGDAPKPVFYCNVGGRLYFGPTPRLRVFYDNSVKTGYRTDPVNYDYAKSIFGLSNDEASYKSKVSFTDALAQSSEFMQEEYYTLAGPKPTSYLDYIVQKDGETCKTYNNDDFELRGVKQYWLRKEPLPSNEKVNKKVDACIKALPVGTKFSGKIRFKNLTSEELGLLLWSIKLEDNSWMNIGMAKSYGFGAISLDRSNFTAKLFKPEKAYSFETGLDMNPFEPIEAKAYVEKYIESMNKVLGRELMSLPSIRSFFIMKNPDEMPETDLIKYMSVNAGHYKNRKARLKSVEEIIDKK